MAKIKAKLDPTPLPATSGDRVSMDWRARDDAQVLQRAGEVMGDKSRHAAARKHLAKHMQGMQKVMAIGANGAAKTPSLGFTKRSSK